MQHLGLLLQVISQISSLCGLQCALCNTLADDLDIWVLWQVSLGWTSSHAWRSIWYVSFKPSDFIVTCQFFNDYCFLSEYQLPCHVYHSSYAQCCWRVVGKIGGRYFSPEFLTILCVWNMCAAGVLVHNSGHYFWGHWVVCSWVNLSQDPKDTVKLLLLVMLSGILNVSKLDLCSWISWNYFKVLGIPHSLGYWYLKTNQVLCNWSTTNAVWKTSQPNEAPYPSWNLIQKLDKH